MQKSTWGNVKGASDSVDLKETVDLAALFEGSLLDVGVRLYPLHPLALFDTPGVELPRLFAVGLLHLRTAVATLSLWSLCPITAAALGGSCRRRTRGRGVAAADEPDGQLLLRLLDGLPLQVQPSLEDVVSNVHVLFSRHVHGVQHQKVTAHPEE